MSMLLTTKSLKCFESGQAKIENEVKGYLRCGEMQTIFVNESEVLSIEFSWMAEAEEYPATPTKWVTCDLLDYEFNPSTYGDIKETINGCLVFRSQLDPEVITLHRPACEIFKLDPSKVEGLSMSVQ